LEPNRLGESFAPLTLTKERLKCALLYAWVRWFSHGLANYEKQKSLTLIWMQRSGGTSSLRLKRLTLFPLSRQAVAKGAVGGQVANAGRTLTGTAATAAATSVCNANIGGACE
jgi:hypothetical protein